MRLPRWLLVSLIILIVLAPLVAAGWWWFTWPSRSLRLFVELMAVGRIEEANGMMKPPQKWVSNPGDMFGVSPLDTAEFLGGNRERIGWQKRFDLAERSIDPMPRSVADVLSGRSGYTLWWPEIERATGDALQAKWYRERFSVPPGSGAHEFQEGYELIVERGQISIRFNSRLVQ